MILTGKEHRLIAPAAAVLVCLITIAPAAGQQATAQKPQMADDVFRNVQVLKGLPVNEFMETMGFFAAALGFNCTGCHTAASLQDWSKFADDIPQKRTARAMILMVNSINKEKFGGARMITCWSCHRGADLPETIPSLASQYSVAPDDPDAIEIFPGVPQVPTADQILDKFIQASGTAQSLAALSSWTARGTIEGFDTYHVKVPVDIYAQAPAQRTLISHTQAGDSKTVFDGSNGWIAGQDRPLPLIPMVPGAELDGAKLDAVLGFPAGIKQALTNWRVGFPVTTIDDKPVNIVQGTGAGKTRVKLYFDEKTGLLTRQVRYANTPVGMVPIQVDYADYRDVAGVKLPYHIVITWTDGQSDILLTEIQANAPLDAAKFARPAPAFAKPQVK